MDKNKESSQMFEQKFIESHLQIASQNVVPINTKLITPGKKSDGATSDKVKKAL